MMILRLFVVNVFLMFVFIIRISLSLELECVLLVYCSNQKGYLYLHVSTNKVIINRYVVFNEKSFPFYQSSSTSNSSFKPSLLPSIITKPAHFHVAKHHDFVLKSYSSHSPPVNPMLDIGANLESPNESFSPQSFIPSKSSVFYSSNALTHVLGNELALVPLPVPHSSILLHPSNNLELSIHLPISSPSLVVLLDARSFMSSVLNAHPMLTRAKDGIVKPKVFNASVSPLNHLEPKSYNVVFSWMEWKEIRIDSLHLCD